jgi:hypothetical protein
VQIREPECLALHHRKPGRLGEGGLRASRAVAGVGVFQGDGAESQSITA